LVHLIRTDDGLYTLVVDSSNVDGGLDFEVDLTQAILWAAQFEVFHNSEHWQNICQRINGEVGVLEANGTPVPAHLVEGGY